MNLYLFPEAACLNNGYGIGVDFAYRKLAPKENDLIVWDTILDKDRMLYLRDQDIVIKKNAFYSVRSVMNILGGKDRTELVAKDLSFLKDFNIDNIHCDEVIFYRALRNIFPTKHITLRLHNCFSRILDRKRLLKLKLDWKYEMKLRSMYQLEREIFNDKNVYKIFISDEDRDYYTSMFGRCSDSETWPYIPEQKTIISNNGAKKLFHKLVWFGGVESHKEASVYWFINHVFVQVREVIPDVEFHLWGKGSAKFDMPDSGIFGHGFYNGEGVPLENALYVNPDIIGGGIKLKLMTYFENGIPFISSPFGFEGYSRELIDNNCCFVEEEDKWTEKIISILVNGN